MRHLLGLRRIMSDSAPGLFSTNSATNEKRALFWALTFFFSITPFFCACYGICTLLCCRHRLRQRQQALLREQAAQTTAPLELPVSTDGQESVTISLAELELLEGNLIDGKAQTNDECPICLKEFEEADKVRQLPACRHSFHPECILKWINKHSTCPLCRTQLLPLPPEAPVGARSQPAS